MSQQLITRWKIKLYNRFTSFWKHCCYLPSAFWSYWDNDREWILQNVCQERYKWEFREFML